MKVRGIAARLDNAPRTDPPAAPINATQPEPIRRLPRYQLSAQHLAPVATPPLPLALRSAAQVLAIAARSPEKLLPAFERAATAAFAGAGDMPRADVADYLWMLAENHRLIDRYGADAIQDILARAANADALDDAADGGTANSKTAWRSWRDRVFSAATLQRQTFPPVSFIVDGLLPEGLSILAGRPKIGKSWLALELAIAVAARCPCLGGRAAADGDVLYAAMEDNPRRLQRRIDKLLGALAASWPQRLALATSWRRLDQGGVEDVRQWAASVPQPRLVILDTLAGVRPVRTNNGYSEDYEALAELHRAANDLGLAILVLHHTRKMDADDPLDTISGTLGLAGCADTALVIARSPHGTTLYVRGRDIEEAEYAIAFDKPTCRWSILGDAVEVRRSGERSRILEVLAGAGEAMGPSDIAAAAGMKPENVRYLLHRMVRDGEVVLRERGRYVAA